MSPSDVLTMAIFIGLGLLVAGIVVAVLEYKERTMMRKILDVFLGRVMEKEGTLPDGTTYAVLTIDGGQHWYTFTHTPDGAITISEPADPALLARIPGLADPIPPYKGKFDRTAVLWFFYVHRMVSGMGTDDISRTLYSPDSGKSWYWTTFQKDERDLWAGDTIDGPAEPELVERLKAEGRIVDLPPFER